MGEHFQIVDPAKRQYLDIGSFGESFKRGGLVTGWRGMSLHAAALAWPVCRLDRDRQLGDIGGAWCGDAIVLAGDGGPPDAECGCPRAALRHDGLDVEWEPEGRFGVGWREEYERAEAKWSRHDR